MSLTLKLLAGVALAVLVSGCGDTFKSDRTSSASPPPDMSAPTASSSASSSASSKDTSMAGGPSATSAPQGKADLSGTANKPGAGTPGGPTDAATTPMAAATGVALSEVKNPSKTLKGAVVKDVKGEAVGEVKSVRLSKGKLTAVNVIVGKKTIALPSDTLTYAQADNTVLSQQTKEELVK